MGVLKGKGYTVYNKENIFYVELRKAKTNIESGRLDSDDSVLEKEVNYHGHTVSSRLLYVHSELEMKTSNDDFQ